MTQWVKVLSPSLKTCGQFQEPTMLEREQQLPASCPLTLHTRMPVQAHTLSVHTLNKTNTTHLIKHTEKMSKD